MNKPQHQQWSGELLSDEKQDVPHLNILGVNVVDLPEHEALALLYQRIAEQEFTPVGFLNAHNANIAHENRSFANLMSEFFVLPDGIGVDMAAKHLYGHKFKDNLNGTDFTPALLKNAPSALKVALYGAAPNVAENAAMIFAGLDERHDVRAVGHGYLDEAGQAEMLNVLLNWRPDILLVAMGVPRQEFWIAEHLTPDHCTMPLAVGALFDLTTGNVPRAPKWMRNLRIEWVYRLAQEPKRLWRRYLVGNPLFLARVIKSRFGGSRSGAS